MCSKMLAWILTNKGISPKNFFTTASSLYVLYVMRYMYAYACLSSQINSEAVSCHTCTHTHMDVVMSFLSFLSLLRFV